MAGRRIAQKGSQLERLTTILASTAQSMPSAADFYERLPIFEGFANVMDPARYRPLPDDWLVGLTDVVSSTQAIDAGRYKAVNTAGASVIAALSNALEGR